MPWLGEFVDPFVAGFFVRHPGVAIKTMCTYALSLTIESFVLPRVMSSALACLRKGIAGLERHLLWLIILYTLAQYSFSAYEDARNELLPRLKAYIMDELVERVMRRYGTRHEGINSALVYSKIDLINQYMGGLIFKVLTGGVPQIISMLALATSFGSLHPYLGVLVGLLLTVHFGIIMANTPSRCREETIAHAQFEAVLTNHLHDRLSNMESVVTAAHGRGLEMETAGVHAMSEYHTLMHLAETNCVTRQKTHSYSSSAVIMMSVISCAYVLWRRRGLGDDDLATVLFTLNVLFNHTYSLSHLIPGVCADLRNLTVHTEFLRSLVVSDRPPAADRIGHTTGDPRDMSVSTTWGCIRLEGVDFQFDALAPAPARPLFRDLSLLVPRGLVVGLVGPSGSGKTTLVRMVLGQIRPSRGRVRLDGVDAHDLPSGTVAYIGQNTSRLFHRPVRFNVEYGHTPAQLRRAYAEHGGTLESFVQAMGLHDVLPDLDADAGLGGERLSGGQRQTVHLLRCILNTRAKVVVLDEPTSALDTAATDAVCRLMWRLARERSRTVLVVTHDPAVERACGAIVRFSQTPAGSLALLTFPQRSPGPARLYDTPTPKKK